MVLFEAVTHYLPKQKTGSAKKGTNWALSMILTNIVFVHRINAITVLKLNPMVFLLQYQFY